MDGAHSILRWCHHVDSSCPTDTPHLFELYNITISDILPFSRYASAGRPCWLSWRDNCDRLLLLSHLAAVAAADHFVL
jgi:hypothetical protein